MSVGTVAHRFATPAAARTKARRNPAGFLRSGRWVLALAVLHVHGIEQLFVCGLHNNDPHRKLELLARQGLEAAQNTVHAW